MAAESAERVIRYTLSPQGAMVASDDGYWVRWKDVAHDLPQLQQDVYKQGMVVDRHSEQIALLESADVSMRMNHRDLESQVKQLWKMVEELLVEVRKLKT